jgi:hypothetical protein
MILAWEVRKYNLEIDPEYFPQNNPTLQGKKDIIRSYAL